MIVKNEAKNIGRCLKSIKDIANEIIVVDTGSADNTKEIAKEYGAKVYDFEWVDDFSKARNYSLEQATGDWILILDGDDEFEREDLFKLLDLINSKAGADIYVFNTICYVGSKPNRDKLMNVNIRLFRNKPDIRYQGRIHEGLRPASRDYVLQYRDINIHHYGYLNDNVKDQNKRERNVRIIEQQLKEDPGNAYFMFCMGNEYFALNELKKALEYFLPSYQNCNIEDIYRPKLMIRIIMAYRVLNRQNEALRYAEEALRDYPRFTDAEFLKGEIYHRMNQTTKAIKSFERCLELGEAPALIGFLMGVGTYKACFALGSVYQQVEDYDEAIKYYNKALQMRNDFHDAIYRIGEIIATLYSNPDDIKSKLEQYFAPDNAESYAMMADILCLIRKFDIALYYINRAMEKNAQVEFLPFLKCKCMFNLKMYEESIKELERIEPDDKCYLNSRTMLCLSYLILERYADAGNMLESIRILNDEGKVYKVYNCLSKILESGEKDILSSDEEESNEYLTIIMDMLGSLICVNEFDKFEKALELLNCIGSNEVLIALAKLYNNYGYIQMAAKEIKRSISVFDKLDEDTAYILYKSISLPATD